MINSSSKKIELKQLIRKLLLDNTDCSCIEIGKKLGISKNYSNKLINEVRDENALKIKNSINEMVKISAEEDYLKLEDKTKKLGIHLYKMVDNEALSSNERTRAIQTLFMMEKTLMDLKINIGLYKTDKNGKSNDLDIPYLVGLIKSIKNEGESL